MAENGVEVPMEVDDKTDLLGSLPDPSIVHWNYCAPEPDILKGFLKIRTSALDKIKESKNFKECDEMTKALKRIVDETLGFRDQIKTFLERKSYLFKTPIEDLPLHPSFLRDYGPPCKTSGFKGASHFVEGLEVLTEVSAAKANLPPRGELKRKELKPGTLVWAMKTNTMDRFVQGTVQSLREGDLYKVRIEDGRSAPPKLYNAKQLAYRELCNVIMPVGTRIVARYSDGMYAGVIAEIPISTNRGRYLVFFDDGYAQYIVHEDIRVMCAQSNDVSNDMNIEVKQFVHEYLAKYPERPMLKLQVNQRIKTEYECNWLDAKVQEVDCSMVRLLFLESGRQEWLYRGSTRLKMLYDELTNAEANRLTGKHRRHNVVPRKPNKPYVEYTREDVVTIDSDSDGENTVPHQTKPVTNGTKPRNTARKSGAMKARTPTLNKNDSKEKYARDVKSHLGSKHWDRLDSYERADFKIHVCSIVCREHKDPRIYMGEKSPFAIPLYLGWERQIRTYRARGTMICVMYRAPCGRQLRNLKEIQNHLFKVSSRVTIDYFSMESSLSPFRFFIPRDVRFKLEDVTGGKENIKISCVNTWSSDPPPHVEYAAKRFPGKGVDLNEDKEFLVGCSCTDFCQNSDTCECQQITNYAHTGQVTGNAGYKFRRLKEGVLTGVYECNGTCKCGPHCGNRVVQNGLQVRLQMFKTERKGWGIRCLDDIEHGQFICIYAGKLLTEQGADDEGRQLGDEYLAELDHIEVNEKTKEGYEEDVHSDMEVDETKDDKSDPSSDSDVNANSSDSDFESSLRTTANTTYSTRSGRKTNMKRPMISNTLNYSKESSNKELPDITSGSDSYIISTRPLSPKSADFVKKIKLKRIPAISEQDPKDAWSLNISMDALTVKPWKPLRAFYGENKSLFVMDAKTKGNIGRYLNHSCDPNLFVQCVFVNTHDLRFHEVAFFAAKYIVAGTELTWDYNYEVGSVQNKKMFCYCDTRFCRGRLL